MTPASAQPKSGRRVLITGATGFLGAHLVERALREGWRVRALVRMIPQTCDVRVDWRRGDITDPALNWEDLVEGVDTAFHLAWTTVPSSANADPVANLEQNLPAGLRLASALARLPGSRLIFFSSGGTVYGLPTAALIAEGHPKAPTSFYGEGKLQMERQLALFGALKGLEHVSLRISNPYGPGQLGVGGFGAVATFAERVALGDEIVIWGDGGVVRDYIFIDDVMNAVVAATNAQTPPIAVNIGSGQGRSLNEIIDGLRKLTMRPVTVRYEPPRAYDVPVNVLDITKARTDLGWAPTVSFEDGLAQTFSAINGGKI